VLGRLLCALEKTTRARERADRVLGSFNRVLETGQRAHNTTEDLPLLMAAAYSLTGLPVVGGLPFI
jgi:hypothetical protein